MYCNEDKLYNLALIALFILVIIQLVNMFSFTFSKKEHMDPALLNHQYVDWPEPRDRNHIPPPQYQEPKFYEENNIYPTSEQPLLLDPLNVKGGIPCGPHFNWMVPHTAGADGRYDDMLWSKTSPKMILRDNCINCKSNGKNKIFNDSESGLPSMGGDGLLENNLSENNL
jgi:hypothetical protein